MPGAAHVRIGAEAIIRLDCSGEVEGSTDGETDDYQLRRGRAIAASSWGQLGLIGVVAAQVGLART